MIVKWKSFLVTKVCYDLKNDDYHLLNEEDDIVDTISRTAYLSHPDLRNLPNGRYRRTAPKDNRRSTNPTLAGIDPGADDDSNAYFTYFPGPGLPLGVWRSMIMMPPEERSKPHLKREGIIATDLIGYRCWRIEGGLLRSVYQHDFWFPNTPLQGRELGDWDQRGIHAWKDAGSECYHEYIRSYLNLGNDMMTQMMMLGTSGKHENLQPAMATGTVLLWGDVVEHERGYRAEFAKVRSLDWLYPDASMMGREVQALEWLREKYGV